MGSMDRATKAASELNEYASRLGVEARTVPSLDGELLGLFVPPGICVLESSSTEAIAVHIDMLAADKLLT
jgi:hypothetical protein